jgi:hypothetical protein
MYEDDDVGSVAVTVASDSASVLATVAIRDNTGDSNALAAPIAAGAVTISQEFAMLGGTLADQLLQRRHNSKVNEIHQKNEQDSADASIQNVYPRTPERNSRHTESIGFNSSNRLKSSHSSAPSTPRSRKPSASIPNMTTNLIAQQTQNLACYLRNVSLPNYHRQSHLDNTNQQQLQQQQFSSQGSDSEYQPSPVLSKALEYLQVQQNLQQQELYQNWDNPPLFQVAHHAVETNAPHEYFDQEEDAHDERHWVHQQFHDPQRPRSTTASASSSRNALSSANTHLHRIKGKKNNRPGSASATAASTKRSSTVNDNYGNTNSDSNANNMMTAGVAHMVYQTRQAQNRKLSKREQEVQERLAQIYLGR